MAASGEVGGWVSVQLSAERRSDPEGWLELGPLSAGKRVRCPSLCMRSWRPGTRKWPIDPRLD